VRADFLLILKQRGQLIIKEQTVIEPGFGILRGVGANQRIDMAALIAGKLDF
jgi:hypothetical protein